MANKLKHGLPFAIVSHGFGFWGFKATLIFYNYKKLGACDSLVVCICCDSPIAVLP